MVVHGDQKRPVALDQLFELVPAGVFSAVAFPWPTINNRVRMPAEFTAGKRDASIQ
jgi:hypothetical protein